MKSYRVFAVTAVVLMLAGCVTVSQQPPPPAVQPPSGSSTSRTVPQGSPLQGHWVGKFTDTRLGQIGTMDLKIDSDGKVSDAIRNDTLDRNTDATGTVDREGKLNYTYVYQGIK